MSKNREETTMSGTPHINSATTMRARSLARRAAVALAAAAGAITLSACNPAEMLTEKAVEFGMEQAIEQSAEGVDIDFDADGGFSVATDDGTFAMSLDEDGFVLAGEDGEAITIAADDEGIVFDAPDISGTVTVGDNGEVLIDTTEGTAVITGDESGGNVAVNSDDFTGSWGVGSAPGGWPVELGQPTTIDMTNSHFAHYQEGGTDHWTGQVTHSPSEDYAAAVVGRSMAAGYELVTEHTTAEATSWELQRGDTTVIVAQLAPGTTIVSAQTVG